MSAVSPPAEMWTTKHVNTKQKTRAALLLLVALAVPGSIAVPVGDGSTVSAVRVRPLALLSPPPTPLY